MTTPDGNATILRQHSLTVGPRKLAKNAMQGLNLPVGSGGILEQHPYMNLT